MTARNETSKHGAGSEKNKRQDEQAAGSHDDVSFKLQSDRFRWSFEDPMHNYIKLQKMRDKEERVKELQSMLETSSSSSESSDDSSGTSHRKHKQRSRSESSTSHRKHKQRSRSESSTSHRKHKRRKEDKPRKKEECKSEVWIEKRDDKNDIDKEKRKRKKDYKRHKSKKQKGDDEDVRKDYQDDPYSECGINTTVKQEISDKTEKCCPSETIHRGERKFKKSKHRHKKDKTFIHD